MYRQVGRETHVYPRFMPKPFTGVSANGCHHNISLWQGDENVFLTEGDDPRLPSEIGLNAIGGGPEHPVASFLTTAETFTHLTRERES